MIVFLIKGFIPDLGRAAILRRFFEGVEVLRDSRVAADKRAIKLDARS